MPIVDLRNTPTVIEVGPGAIVAEFTEESLTAQVMVGPTVVEFSWGELIPGPGLKGGGPFEGTVYIDQDIPGLPPGIEPLDPVNDLVMVWDESRQEHVKRPAALGGGGVEFATVPEAEAAIIADKAIAPDVAGIVYDRLHHWGIHTAGKGTQSFNLVDDYSITLNSRASNVFRVTLQGNRTLILPVNPVPGQVIKLRFKQDAVGGRTMTWPVGIRWIMGITPVMTIAPHAVDVVFLAYDEVDGVWEGSFLPDYTGTGTGWGILPAGPPGTPGTPGLVGPAGPTGPAGISPTGGVTGDVLTKLSAVDGDYDWVSLGSFTFAGLGDVNVASVVNGDSIIWDSTTSKWIPAIFGMAGLVDVSLTGLVDNQILVYNSTGTLWTPETLIAAHITDFSEAVDDRVAALIVPGNNVDVTYDDVANTFTIDVEAITSADLADFAEAVDDRLAALIVPGNNIDVTYNDAADTFTIDVEGLTSADLSDFNEAVDDRVSSLLVEGSNITLTYDDIAGTITIDSTATGSGVPVGGTTGQALVKLSGADGDAGWSTISGGGGGGGNPAVLSALAADKVVSSNTVYQDTDISIALEAGSTYRISGSLNTLGLASNIAYFRLNFTGTVTTCQGMWMIHTSGGGTAQYTEHFETIAGTELGVGTTADHGLLYDFIFTPATAGTLTVQIKQGTSSATAIKLYAGSYLTAERMATSWAGVDSGCVITRAALQTFNTTPAAISWDTEVTDTESYYDSGTPTRITIPKAGWYTITGTVAQNTDADDAQTLYFRKNGAAYSTAQHQTRLGSSTSVTAASQVIDTDYYAAGDYLELWVANRTGSSTAYARCSIVRHSGPTGPKGDKGDIGGNAKDVYKYQVADLVFTNDAVYRDTDLVVPLKAGRRYIFEHSGHCYNHATPDMKRRFHYTGTVGHFRSHIAVLIAGNSTTYAGMHTAISTDSVLTSTAEHSDYQIGTIEPTTDGNFSYQAAQNVSSATSVIVRRGNFLRVTDVNETGATTIDTEIDADNPLAWWKLDEASGNFVDSSGNGYDLTVTGAGYTYQHTYIDGSDTLYASRNASGSGTYASRSDGLGLTMPYTGDYTIECIIVPNTVVTNSIRILQIGGDPTLETEAANTQLFFYTDATATAILQWESGAGTNRIVTSPLVVTEDTACHLAVVKDSAAQTVQFYLNGRKTGAAIAYTNEPTGGTGALTTYVFGQPAQTCAAAAMGHVAFYNSKLSATRIRAHARAAGFI